MSAAGGGAVSHVDGFHVVLVEDDEGDARLVVDDLAEALPQTRVTRARTLEEALRLLDGTVDCALLDLRLPDASGLDAVSRVRASAPAIPLIVLTGLDDAAAGVGAVQAGAQDYLVKGRVGGDQLARAIRYAIGRRRVEEQERELLLAKAQAQEVARLERGLTPPPVIDPKTAWVASCYRAGRRSALLGGDFFDLVQVSDERLQMVIGDVCGRGPDEAALGVSLRAAWRALVLAGTRLDVTLATLARLVEQERHLPSLFATLCTVEVLVGRGTASVIRAGHPRPVLIAGAAVGPLARGDGGAVIGVERRAWPVEEVRLPAGWTVLMYTDGLIEGRIGAGAERLGEAGLHRLIAARVQRGSKWQRRPEALLGELIADAERLNGGALEDDVAMLLVGARPAAAAAAAG